MSASRQGDRPSPATLTRLGARCAPAVLIACAAWLVVAGLRKEIGRSDAGSKPSAEDRAAGGRAVADVPEAASAATEGVAAAVTAGVAEAVQAMSAAIDTAPTAEPGVEVVGDQWSSYPRTKFGVGWYLACMSEAVAARSLVRNVHLNARDQPIPEALVEQLDALLRRHVAPVVGQINTAMTLAAGQDILALGDDLAWQTVGTRGPVVRKDGGTTVMSRVHLPTDGPTFVYRSTPGGGYRAVATNSLPTVRKLKEARAFFVTELGCAIVAWFVGIGICTIEEAEVVRAEVFEQAQRSMR